MELLHTFLNLVFPPTSFITLCLFLPPYLFFNFWLSVLRSIFSENISGKVVLITGASSGIGEHLAYEYARRGAYLVLVARRENRLRDVAERAREFGSPDVLVICADVSKIDDCKRFIDEAVNHFGRLDHLVNNAGLSSLAMFEDCGDVTNYSSIMDVNFWGAVYPTYFATPHLKQNNGKIIVLASAAGWLPIPRMSFYNQISANKFLVDVAGGTRVSYQNHNSDSWPGFVESELTQGKFLTKTKDGKLEIDQEMRDVLIGPTPVMSTEGCAKGIVNSVCRGERYVTEPAWFKITYLWKVFCPEVVEWILRILYITGPGISQREALNKKILDVTGAKNILYPASIQSRLTERICKNGDQYN